MRPYFGILRDSFHEAFASRVLWILLVLTTLFLLFLAPLGTSEKAGSHLGGDDILDRQSLAKKLVAQGQDAKPSPAAHIWAQLSDEAQQKLRNATTEETDKRSQVRGATNQLRDELNALFTQRDFYQPAAWESMKLDREARDLLAKGLDKLPDDQLARFNRLALEAAFPDEIVVSGKKQVQMAYLMWDFGPPLPISVKDLRPAINQILLAFMVLALGVAGILVAVLVTASIIPHTFEAGAIDLLLSKPVSRAWVFLTKFFGGCAFILINTSYLIGGLYLIVGWRFELWNHKLLLCIPLFLFLFAIYYAVSALSGLIWRNAIVCVVMAIVFWGTCWSIGTAHNLIEALLLNPSRIVRIVPAGESLLAVSERGAVLQWNADAANWEAVFADPAPRRGPAAAFGISVPLVGPIYDEKGDRILAANQTIPQFAMFSSNALFVGKRADEWKRNEGITTPSQTEALFIGRDNALLAVGAKGVFRLEGNPEDKPQSTKVFGFDLQMPGAGAKFVEETKGLRFSTPLSAALDANTGRLAVYDGRKLAVLEPNDKGTYTVLKELEIEPNEAGVVGLAGQHLLLVMKDGESRLYDATTLATPQVTTPANPRTPRYVTASPDGRWLATLFHDGWLDFYDTKTHQPAHPSITGQGDISAAVFTADGLLVADRLTRVTEYRLDGWQVQRRRQAAMGNWELAYRYGVHPLYTVFPKPGALDNMVSYLLNDDKTVAAGPRGEEDLGAARIKIDVWGPIWSNLAFLSVVLAIGCGYVARKDF